MFLDEIDRKAKNHYLAEMGLPVEHTKFRVLPLSFDFYKLQTEQILVQQPSLAVIRYNGVTTAQIIQPLMPV